MLFKRLYGKKLICGESENMEEKEVVEVVELAGDNPGAVKTLIELKDADPRHFEEHISTLKMMGLRADRLYMLWNDSCDRDINKFIKILIAYKYRIITQKEIEERIFNVGWGKSFDDLLEKLGLEVI